MYVRMYKSDMFGPALFSFRRNLPSYICQILQRNSDPVFRSLKPGMPVIKKRRISSGSRETLPIQMNSFHLSRLNDFSWRYRTTREHVTKYAVLLALSFPFNPFCTPVSFPGFAREKRKKVRLFRGRAIFKRIYKLPDKSRATSLFKFPDCRRASIVVSLCTRQETSSSSSSPLSSETTASYGQSSLFLRPLSSHCNCRRTGITGWELERWNSATAYRSAARV